jgi:hypothetical protein
VTDLVNSEISKVCGEGHDDYLPNLSCIRLDDRHLLIRIEYTTSEVMAGELRIVSNFGILRELDKVLRFQELQGLPRAYWTLWLEENPALSVET